VIGDLDWADELLTDVEARCGGNLRPVWENERAAWLWQRGRCAEALSAWERMAATPAAQFNYGMALLFLGRPTDAAPALTAAAESLPETSGWGDLARLYLAVAEIHGG
jgi:predicted Zn-dependent protease